MFRYHGTVFIYVFIYNFLFKIIFLFLFTNLLSSKKPRRSRPPLWNQGCWAFRPPAFLFLPTLRSRFLFRITAPCCRCLNMKHVCEMFAKFLNFLHVFEVFVSVWTHLDLSRRIRTPLDAYGSLQKRLDELGQFVPFVIILSF